MVKSYLRYCLKAAHRKGFGIHSPFVFRLLNAVFFEKTPYYCYHSLEQLEDYLAHSKSILSHCLKKRVRRIKYYRLLFRLANYNASLSLLELGFDTCLSTLYLSKVNSKAKFISINSEKQITEALQKTVENQSVDIRYSEHLDAVLPSVTDEFESLDFVFFNDNVSAHVLLQRFALCLTKARPSSIFVFRDIHSSLEMEAAWDAIRQRPDVRLSIDIYCFGVIFFNTDLIKQDYIVAF